MAGPAPAHSASSRPVVRPIDWSIGPSTIAATCSAALRDAGAAADRIAALRPAARTYGATVIALEDLTADLDDRLVAERNLEILAPDPAVRAASDHCTYRVARFVAGLTAWPDMYRAIADRRTEYGAHGPLDRRLRADWIETMRRSGATLPTDTRERLLDDLDDIRALEGEFLANLDNDPSAISIGARQAASLPPGFLARLRRLPEHGYMVPVNESTFQSFLNNEADAAARNAYVTAYNNRAAAANVPLLQEALAKREDAARLLGYPTWSAYVIAGGMAGSPERVRRFLEDLDARLLPKAKHDLSRLIALKSRLTGVPSTTLEPGDYTYYSAQMRRLEYDLDPKTVREYFPVEHVLEATMAIYGRLFGITLARMWPANAWAPDVSKYVATDSRTGRPVGILYLDLFPRPGKYAHTANVSLLPVRRLPDGEVQVPVSAIIANYQPSAPGRPALLSHTEVTSLFHEFGHAMATLLADTPYETLSRGSARDFTEAPSQLMENWVWDPGIVKQLSRNVHTGDPMPDGMVARLVAGRTFGQPLQWTRTVALALIDLDFNSGGLHPDTTAVYEDVLARYAALPMPPGTHPQASWTHEMDGYDAAYYGYPWAKVYAQEMFAVFRSAGLENPAAGERFRALVLGPAGSLDPETEVAHFAGGPVSPIPFYRDLGLDSEVRASNR